MWNTAGKNRHKTCLWLLPVHPVDCHLLAMHWKNQIFVDTCLPFSLQSAPELLISWQISLPGSWNSRSNTNSHYLDDLLLMGPPQSPTCQDNLSTVKQVCSLLEISLALEKVEGPSDSLTFLGITLDTPYMEACLPAEKLQCINKAILSFTIILYSTHCYVALIYFNV